MKPTVFREGPFHFVFFSRDEPRMHVHVSHPDGESNVWLKPGVEVPVQTGLAARLVYEARYLVANHLQEIVDAWDRNFAGWVIARFTAWPLAAGRTRGTFHAIQALLLVQGRRD